MNMRYYGDYKKEDECKCERNTSRKRVSVIYHYKSPITVIG